MVKSCTISQWNLIMLNCRSSCLFALNSRKLWLMLKEEQASIVQVLSVNSPYETSNLSEFESILKMSHFPVHCWRVEEIGGFCSTHTRRDDFSAPEWARHAETQRRHCHKNTLVYPVVVGHVRRGRRIAAMASEEFLSETAYTIEV